MNIKNLIVFTGVLGGSIGLSVISYKVTYKTLEWVIDRAIKQKNTKALKNLEANNISEIKDFIEEMDKSLREGQHILEFMGGE